MSTEEIPIYRKHRLVIRFHEGKYKGRVYPPEGPKLTEITGAGHNELLVLLQNYVDATFVNKANSRMSPPGANEYIQAFQSVLKDLPASYLAMLKAHYHAPNRTLTATQLAKAGEYANWHSANLHYGLFGRKLYEELPIQLPKRADGTLIYTCALATEGDTVEDESQFQWKMRPEVAQAIEQMGLFN